jgi:hypothetical protein
MINDEDDLDSMGEELEDDMKEIKKPEGFVLTEEKQDFVIGILNFLRYSQGKFEDKIFPKIFPVFTNL